MKSIYQIVNKQRKFLKRCGYKYTTSALSETEFTVILNKKYKNNDEVIDLDDADYIVHIDISKQAIEKDQITYSECVILGANKRDIPNFVKKFENRIANAVYYETLQDEFNEGKVY